MNLALLSKTFIRINLMMPFMPADFSCHKKPKLTLIFRTLISIRLNISFSDPFLIPVRYLKTPLGSVRLSHQQNRLSVNIPFPSCFKTWSTLQPSQLPKATTTEFGGGDDMPPPHCSFQTTLSSLLNKPAHLSFMTSNNSTKSLSLLQCPNNAQASLPFPWLPDTVSHPTPVVTLSGLHCPQGRSA